MISNTASNHPTWQEARREAWGRDKVRRITWYVSLVMMTAVTFLMAVIGVPERGLQIGIVSIVAPPIIILYGLVEEIYDLKRYHERMSTEVSFKKAVMKSWDNPNLPMRAILLAATAFLVVVIVVQVFKDTSWTAVLWAFVIGAILLILLRLIYKWDLHQN